MNKKNNKKGREKEFLKNDYENEKNHDYWKEIVECSFFFLNPSKACINLFIDFIAHFSFKYTQLYNVE